jgi:hypothetical protein
MWLLNSNAILVEVWSENMTTISNETHPMTTRRPAVDRPGALLLGTGLAMASLILLPALAARLGLHESLTGALRIALMKASHRAANGGARSDDAETCPEGFSCH